MTGVFNTEQAVFVCDYGGPIVTDLRFRRQYLHERQVLLKRYVPRFREGLIDAIVVPVDSFDDLSILMAEIAEAEEALQLVRAPAQVAAVKAAGRIAVLLGVTFEAIGAKVDVLYSYQALGMCMVPFSGNPRNLLTDGCGERGASGLSYYGLKVAKKLTELGALIDVSHTSDAGFWDIAKAITGPFVASHSNARALCDSPRNLTDDQMRTIADHGGVVSLSTYPTLISRNENPSLDDFMNQLDYIVKVVGVEHVGIGADFVDTVRDFVMAKVMGSDPTGAIYAGREDPTNGLAGLADMKHVVSALTSRGYDDRARKAILGANFLRAWETAQRQAGNAIGAATSLAVAAQPTPAAPDKVAR